MPISEPCETETPEALGTRSIAGFDRPLKCTPKLHLTTALTTDSEIFRNRKSKYPGVAQLVARVVWDHQAAGSNPVTRTKIPLKSLISAGFFLEKVRILHFCLPPVLRALEPGFFFDYCGAILEFAPFRCFLVICTILLYNELTVGLVPAAPAVWIFHAAVLLQVIALFEHQSTLIK